METLLRNKWQVRVAALLIFVFGFVAGALALNLYRGWGRRPAPGDRFERMATRLQLNDDQKTKVQQIFADTRQQLEDLQKQSEPRVHEIRQQADQRLQQVLNADQWQQFQKMRSEGRGRRGRGEPGNRR